MNKPFLGVQPLPFIGSALTGRLIELWQPDKISFAFDAVTLKVTHQQLFR